MQIEVLFFGRPRELTGTSRELVSVKDGVLLRDLFETLSGKYGEGLANELRRIEGLIVFVNGRDYKMLGGLDAVLKDEDTVAILPVVTGG